MKQIPVLLLIGVNACGSSAGSSEGPADADRKDSAPVIEAGADSGASTYKVIRLDNALCMSSALSTVNGLVACRILLQDVAGGCAAGGLHAAQQTDVDGITAALKSQGAPAPQGALCELQQVSGATSGIGCSSEATPAWCYVDGSCDSNDSGAMCRHALCKTDTFLAEMASFEGAWLACP